MRPLIISKETNKSSACGETQLENPLKQVLNRHKFKFYTVSQSQAILRTTYESKTKEPSAKSGYNHRNWMNGWNGGNNATGKVGECQRPHLQLSKRTSNKLQKWMEIADLQRIAEA